MNKEYSRKYCGEHQAAFIDLNPYIRDTLDLYPDSLFLLDCIHQNAGKGVVMYSEAVLSY